MLVKFCGARSAVEVTRVAAAGADLVGLWHGVPGGLPASRAAALARSAPPGLRPVLVTFLPDARRLREAVAATGVRWVQLHGFQQPSVVRALKAEPGLTVVKVLHLGVDGCVEQPLIRAYERAGTDLFLLDRMVGPDRVGSTGLPLPACAPETAARLARPFLVAGGITAEIGAYHRELAALPHFAGIDTDSAARDGSGRLSLARCAEITERWRTRERIFA